MPGMSAHPVSLANPFVVQMFHHALYVTGLLWLSAIAIVLISIEVVSKRILRFNLSGAGLTEPRARTYLRWGFGALWLFDGILQFQPSMPLGLGSVVVAPAQHGTPSWLHTLMNHGLSLWYSHPVSLAVGVAWIQVGFGLALLASNGLTGRVAGADQRRVGRTDLARGQRRGRDLRATGRPCSSAGPVRRSSTRWPGCGSRSRRRPSHGGSLRSRLRVLAVVLLVAAVIQCLPAAGFWHGGTANALNADDVGDDRRRPTALARVPRAPRRRTRRRGWAGGSTSSSCCGWSSRPWGSG